MVFALIPAAGVGERFGDERPKQYCLIHGKPLICYTVEAAASISCTTLIIVICDDIQKMRDALKHVENNIAKKVIVLRGSHSRHRSIKAGVEYLSSLANPEDIVIVHDGVRPLLPEAIVNDIITMAKKFGAAGPVCRLVSTVLKVNDDFLESVLPRNDYVNSEMPQGFKYSVLKESYQTATEEELNHGTEILDLVSKHTSSCIRLVQGTQDLWKLTYPQDIIKTTILLQKSITVGIAKPPPGFPDIHKYSRCKLVPFDICAAQDITYVISFEHNIVYPSIQCQVNIKKPCNQLDIAELKKTKDPKTHYVITDKFDTSLIDYCIDIIMSPNSYPWISIS